ncbi:MAG: hypothetical protein M1812_003474 [Candelaria pacifica]|nr:MAG: hypothetical protein M1812_003474 [Candelaria pacifica]
MSADKPSGRTGVQTLTGKSQTSSMNDGSQQRKIRASVKPQSEPTMKRAVSNSSSSLARNKTICSSYPTGNHGTASIRNEGGETLPSLPYHSHMPFAISQIDSKDSHSFLGPTQQILPSNSRVQSQSYLSGHHHGDSNMLSASRSLPDVMSIKGVVQPKVQGYASHLMENKSVSDILASTLEMVGL